MQAPDDLQLLVDAARAAGPIALSHRRADMEVWEKSDGQGPVTTADLAVDQMLKARLTAARPTYGWLSEETEDTADRLTQETVFIVDPIDGTRAFLAGREGWAHALAVVHRGSVVAGAIYLPDLDLMYAAARGHGAWCNDTRLQVTDPPGLQGARLLGQKSNFAPEHWGVAPLPVTQHFRSSLAYRLGLVADGSFDGMITLRPCWEWDVAAGALIVAEAGGTATGRDGEGLQFNTPGAKTPGLIAAPAAVHNALMDRRPAPG